MIIEFDRKHSDMPLNDLLDRIEAASHEEVDAIIDALKNRYKRLFPEWEIAFLSIPTGNPESRKKQARLLIEFIRNNWLNP